jgi:hypothetical protein
VASWLLLVTTLPEPPWPRTARYRTRWQMELVFKRSKQLWRAHGLPSHRTLTNTVILALLLIGWALLDQHATHLPPHSVWHWTTVGVDTRRV